MLELLHVFERGEFGLALSVERYLNAHGIEAKLVTRHAVKVPTGTKAAAVELMADYRWAWDRKPGAESVAK